MAKPNSALMNCLTLLIVLLLPGIGNLFPGYECSAVDFLNLPFERDLFAARSKGMLIKN